MARNNSKALTHEQVWNAIDLLAENHDLSASGLAKAAGLDPTTFNKSKRITSDQRQRWPSTESVAKCLAATGVGLDQFVGLIAPAPHGAVRTMPLIGLAEAGEGRHFDERGFPDGDGWDELGFPAIEDRNAYALEVAGDTLRPIYRDGTMIIVSPTAAIRRGDRVVVKLRGGEVVVRELVRKTTKAIDLRTLGASPSERALASEDYLWIARIVWASQ